MKYLPLYIAAIPAIIIYFLARLITAPFRWMWKDLTAERRRKNTPCRFEDGFSEEEFEQMAIHAAKKIKRLRVEVSGPIVYGTVQSQSGISEWNFKVDYNDYGHVTGTYWLSSENHDSKIPEAYADRLSEEIQDY